MISEMHPMGEAAWVGGARMPPATELVALATDILGRVRLSVLFEDHPAYTPIHAIVRHSGFAAEMYDQARRIAEGAAGGEDFLPLAIPIVNRLETSIIALDRAVRQIEAMRARMGGLPGFSLRRSGPATRGDHPVAISKAELRSLGDRDRLHKLRNALAHADQRVNQDESGDRLLVPRCDGVSLDDLGLAYAELVQMMTRLLAIANEALEAGGVEGLHDSGRSL